MRPDLIYCYMCFHCDRDTPDVTGGMNVQQFAEYLDQTDPIVHLNDDMIMVGRVSILLRGTLSPKTINLETSPHNLQVIIWYNVLSFG